MRKTSIAVFHPRLGFGGSEAAALWTVQALKRDYRVTLVAGGRIDLGALNVFYGTSIQPAECEILRIRLPWPLAEIQRGAALRGAFFDRGIRVYSDRFDVLISSYNFGSFGRPGIHLLADFSWDETLRRELDAGTRAPRGKRLPRKAYLGLVGAISTRAESGEPRDLGIVLANSRWSGEILRVRHGIDANVLYPPVTMCAPAASAERRRRRFVCVGRVAPEKRVESAIQVLRAVRGRGHDISLHIIGDTRENAYGRKIERLCRREGKWIVLEGRQLGETKARLIAESAFGIHACAGEAFGIAVAEMISVGCIPFVPAEGGPAEIAEYNPALVYSTLEEGIDKIDAMLRNPPLERDTRASLLNRARLFSHESFMRGIRETIASFVRGDRIDKEAPA